jgi:ppGpp synthetase/RelA/SpoT-type nucleotidyltranferase
MAKIPISKHREDIEKFKIRQNDYKLYARVLEEVLKKAVDIFAPLGVVQARAKKIESFSEKIIRKDKYKNPLLDMTDLCGARAIVHFESQVVEICKFIRDNFEVDEANSIDVKTRLNVGEFGYRSVHYIVTPVKDEILGVSIPKTIQDLKAEIQVRTFNEHVWADILHDRIYKTRINVPKQWQRESARLAALLEEVDNSFVKISETLDQFSINYRPTPDVSKLENEVFVLKTLIEINPEINDKTIENCLKLAVIYNLQGKWDEIISLLTPPLSQIDKLKKTDLIGRLKYELGYALCIKNKKQSAGTSFLKGMLLIEESLKLLGDEFLYYLDISKASFLLARVYAVKGSPEAEISRLLTRARKFSPENPYYMLQSIIEKLGMQRDCMTEIDEYASSLREIITTCQEHIEIGIETVDAFITIAVSNWLLGDENEAIRNLIELMQLVRLQKVPCSENSFTDGIEMLRKINEPQKSSVLTGILHLICWKNFGDPDSKKSLEKYRHPGLNFTNVLVIAGKSGSMEQKQHEKYENYIKEALRDFEGTVICGGTNTGLPGIVGTLTAKLRKTDLASYTLLGYMPEKLPDNVTRGSGYDRYITSATNDFSFLDAFKYWVDILFSEIPFDKILVLGINGKTISELEYSFALSMGINLALVDKSGGAADNIIQNPLWKEEPGLLLLPPDPDTIWALVTQNRKISFTPQETLLLAEEVHNFYRKERLSSLKPDTQNIDDLKVVMTWDKLDPKLKISNLKQVEFYEHLLNQVGLCIRKSVNPKIFPLDGTFKDIDRLARLEHARWNAERLLAGWRYGVTKDIKKKQNPCIVSWDDLSEDIRKFDYDPIKNIPVLLAKIGYEIVEKAEF